MYIGQSFLDELVYKSADPVKSPPIENKIKADNFFIVLPAASKNHSPQVLPSSLGVTAVDPGFCEEGFIFGVISPNLSSVVKTPVIYKTFDPLGWFY